MILSALSNLGCFFLRTYAGKRPAADDLSYEEYPHFLMQVIFTIVVLFDAQHLGLLIFQSGKGLRRRYWKGTTALRDRAFLPHAKIRLAIYIFLYGRTNMTGVLSNVLRNVDALSYLLSL